MKYEIKITDRQALTIKEVLVSRLNEMWDDLNNEEIPYMLKRSIKKLYVEQKLDLREVFEQLEPMVEQCLSTIRKNDCPDELMRRVIERVTLKDPYATQKNLH